MDVREAAARLGVSPRRVRTLISEGKVDARKAGRHWKIDELPQTRSARRPLSPRSRQQLAAALHSRSLDGLVGQERARTASRIRALRSSDDPATLLLDWWGGQPEERDRFVRSLLLRAQAGDRSGVRDTLRERHPAYLSTPQRLSERIATERAIRALTFSELAELAGVDASNVRDLERGRMQKTPGPARRVLKALDVTPSALPPLGVTS